MLFGVLLVATALCFGASARDVTNEDLRSSIMGVAHLTKEAADRLIGHDRREQQFAEHLKRSLTGVDRRLNAVDAPLRELQGRVANMEGALKDLERGTTSAMERQAGALAAIQKTLQELAFHPGVGGGPGPGEAVAVVPVGQALGEEILAAVQRLDQRTASAARDAVDAAFLRRHNETLRAAQHLAEEVAAGVTASLTQRLTVVLAEQLTQLAQQQQQRMASGEAAAALATSLSSSVVDRLSQRLDQQDQLRAAELKAANQEARDELIENLGDIVTTNTRLLVNDVAKSYESVTKELGMLAGVERVLIQTGDNVIETKRRIEYGVHQIMHEVGTLVKDQSKELNETLNERFDVISADILSHQKENLGNLSTKIETEISQVWRQIGIMYEQLTASKSMLDRLQQQTEVYVNGSLQTMDGMEGKVGQITGRMGEVDENLNYLLGRLSLVTQEFSQIKSGLASSLDSVRKSFLELQGQMTDLGPGPNPIPTDPPAPAIVAPNRQRPQRPADTAADNQV